MRKRKLKTIELTVEYEAITSEYMNTHIHIEIYIVLVTLPARQREKMFIINVAN